MFSLTLSEQSSKRFFNLSNWMNVDFVLACIDALYVM